MPKMYAEWMRVSSLGGMPVRGGGVGRLVSIAPAQPQVQASVTEAKLWVTPKPGQCGVQVDGGVETDYNNVKVTLALENAAGDKTPAQVVQTKQTTHGYKGQFSALFDMSTSGEGSWVTQSEGGPVQWGLPGSSNTPSNQKTGSWKIVTAAPNMIESNVGTFDFVCMQEAIAILPKGEVNPNIPQVAGIQATVPAQGDTPRFGAKAVQPDPKQAVVAIPPSGAGPRTGALPGAPETQGEGPRFGAKVISPEPKQAVAALPEGRSIGGDVPGQLGACLPTSAAACPPPNQSCKYNGGSSCWYNCQMDGGIDLRHLCQEQWQRGR